MVAWCGDPSQKGVMPRLIYSLFLVALAVLAGCGLSERERAVVHTNQAIEAVQESIHEIADLINSLAEEEITPAQLRPLHAALTTYMDRMDQVGEALRTLGTHIPELETYVVSTFRPASESAATACQSALRTLHDAEATEEDTTRALTQVGVCLDRYATAVTNVSAEYNRLPR
jgi:hypothetical protein